MLSSVEAFARSLAVHRRTVARHWAREQAAGATGDEHDATAAMAQPPASEVAAASPDDEGRLFLTPPTADDERGEQDAELAEAEEEAQIEAITQAAESGAAPDPGAERAALWRQEQELLDRMQAVAGQARHVPDAKTRQLIDWMREEMCPELPPFGRSPRGRPPRWNERRVLIFTENREGTKRYLRAILEQAIARTDRADERIEVIDGLTQGARRKEIQRRFNADPAADPLRILLATDAAREGLNFQAHCADLFHFDLPWNPGRIEQRNGRIDRKLQPAPEVRCHYFVLPQRVEDGVLEVLVRKTDTIKRELGSLSKVIDDDVERRLRGGIRHRDADRLKHAIEAADLDEVRRRITEEELEAARDRRDDLAAQVERCRGLLERSRSWVGFEAEPFRDALSCALELLGAEPLARDGGGNGGDPGQATWTFPALDRRTGADPTWAATLDTLRPPRRRDQKLADWRREAPIRPVVFEDAGVLGDDTVHLHLEQRVAQRLLARFRAQGFVHHDLSRACFAQARDSIPRVVLLGRLCPTGAGPSGCTKRSSPWPPDGSSRGGGAAPSEPTPARPRRAPSTCSSSRWPAAPTGRRTTSSGPGCWRRRRATSKSCCPSSSRGPTRSASWRRAGYASGESERPATSTRRSAASASESSKSSTVTRAGSPRSRSTSTRTNDVSSSRTCATGAPASTSSTGT